jgi:signal transduction histidine kinase
MPDPAGQNISLTIAITTLFLLLVGAIAARYIFLFQERKFRNREEIAALRETFSQTLLQSKLEIQEQTLDHISKELHANVGHLASLIQIGLEELSMKTSGTLRESALETRGLAGQLLAELKAVNASLNTDHIMHIGLEHALKNELQRIGKAKNYIIAFARNGQEYPLSPEHEIILYRLCQEALNNIVLYSQAKHVSITLNYLESVFRLEIKDDGVGFDPDEALKRSAEKSSTGLLNMKKRASLINGTIVIDSSPGKGTKVVIEIISSSK